MKESAITLFTAHETLNHCNYYNITKKSMMRFEPKSINSLPCAIVLERFILQRAIVDEKGNRNS